MTDDKCDKCKVTGQWDSNWEKFLNDWSAGWIYRTLSAGRLNANCLGQMGYVANVDGKWMILEGQPPNPGEGGNWITLISSDTLKLQQALQGQKPDLFGALKPIGAWDMRWAQALDAWGKSDDWKPANWNPQVQWPGIQLLNERRVAPALLERLVPQVVGQPLEDEHWGANGDSLQQTTTGLMVWRKADNWTAFTNGSRTWINGPAGVQDRANDDRFPWES